MFFSIQQAGARTSFAREAGEADTVKMCEGLRLSMEALGKLLENEPDNEGLLEKRAYLIEEVRTMGRRFTAEGKKSTDIGSPNYEPCNLKCKIRPLTTFLLLS
jgi:hypothetical protein